MASGLAFRSLTYFVFPFARGVRECSSFTISLVAVPVSPAPLTKEAVLPMHILASFVAHFR